MRNAANSLAIALAHCNLERGSNHLGIALVRFATLLLLGLALMPTAHAQPVANPQDQTRTSSFAYNASGLLVQETVEPDNPELCVVTSHFYDAYGNRERSSTAHCAGAPARAQFPTRGTRAEFGAQAVGPLPSGSSTPNVPIPAGTFATSGKVAVSLVLSDPHADPNTDAAAHVETRRYDPRFGTLIQLTGPNGLSTQWQYDAFGRATAEIRADGNRTITRYCFLPNTSGPVIDTSSNSVDCPSARPAEAPPEAIFMQETVPLGISGSNVSPLTGAAVGPWSRTYQDSAGRVIRTATQSFDGPSQPAALSGAVVVQDTLYNAHGAAIRSTSPYFLSSRTTGTTGSADVIGLTQTKYDFLGRPVAVHKTDPTAGGTEDFGAPYGALKATSSRIVYQGLQSTTFDAAGRARTEEKAADGKVIRITDTNGAQVVHQYDALGNLIQTTDALQNTIRVSYDLRGRKVRLQDPEAGSTDFCYDAAGQLKAQQTSNMRGGHGTSACPAGASIGRDALLVSGAVWTTMAYDRLGRLTQRIDPEYTSSWYHDKDSAGASCGKGIGKTCQSITNHGVTRTHWYDNLGRAERSRTVVSTSGGGASITAVSAVIYDTLGRPQVQTYPTGVQLRYEYTGLGFLQTVRGNHAMVIGGSSQSNPVFWQAGTVDAAGRSELQSYGNNVLSRATFDPRSGRLTQLGAGTAANPLGVVDQTLVWDNLGQLTLRIDAIGADSSPRVAIQDNYTYDNLGRLTRYQVAGNGTPTSRTVDLQYNAAGMLLYKSDVGIYSYAAQGTANGQPHALRSVSGLHAGSYTYDLNGNLTTASVGKYRSVAYTSFNLPDSGNGLQGPSGSPKYTWHYDENRARIRETRVNAQGTRTTWSLHPDSMGGLAFEREEGLGTAQNRHYISAGGGTVAVLVTEGALPVVANGAVPAAAANVAVAKLEYWHKDHLGSLIATTNAVGAVTARYSYDPFGKRRSVNGTYDPFGNIVVDWGASASASASGTDRGYTGHEHLDDVGVIHMNGRIFDPMLARFMQADPLIQSPENLQNYDRYAYCFNAPTTCTDPSGYKSLRQHFRAIDTYIRRPSVEHWHGVFRSQPGQAKIDRFFMENEVAYMAAKIVVAYFTFGLGSAGMDAYYNYERTGSANSSFKVFAVGAATSLAFYGVGQATTTAYSYDVFNAAGMPIGAVTVTSQNAFAAVVGHALVGCASAEASGGNCGSGALAAAFGKAATIAGPNFSQSSDPFVRVGAGTAWAAMAGGIGAELGGGKFANGAQTGAMGYLFNELMHSGWGGTDKQRLQLSGYDEFEYSDGTVCNGAGDPSCRVPKQNRPGEYSYDRSKCVTAECAAGVRPAPSENRTQGQIDVSLCETTCGWVGPGGPLPTGLGRKIFEWLGKQAGTQVGCKAICAPPKKEGP